MNTVAMVSVVVVAVAAISGLAVLILRRRGSRAGGQRRGFSGGEMLMPGGVTFGHRGRAPRPQPGTNRPKRLKFRNLKQLEEPSIRSGDIDFWAARQGIESRSQALRLLVGKALSSAKPR